MAVAVVSVSLVVMAHRTCSGRRVGRVEVIVTTGSDAAPEDRRACPTIDGCARRQPSRTADRSDPTALGHGRSAAPAVQVTARLQRAIGDPSTLTVIQGGRVR